jgi:hypothetical protein
MTHLNTFQVPHREAYQVSAIVLALPGRRQVGTLHLDHGARQKCRGIAILNSIQPRDQPVTLRLPFDQLTRYMLAGANS